MNHAAHTVNPGLEATQVRVTDCFLTAWTCRTGFNCADSSDDDVRDVPSLCSHMERQVCVFVNLVRK